MEGLMSELSRRDIQQLVEAKRTAELFNMNFARPTERITLSDGEVVSADQYIKEKVRQSLLSLCAAPIIAVLDRRGWMGSY